MKAISPFRAWTQNILLIKAVTRADKIQKEETYRQFLTYDSSTYDFSIS